MNCPEENLRRELFCVMKKGTLYHTSYGKCHYCRIYHKEPDVDNLDGMNDKDFVPCGHLWKEAAVEYICVRAGWLNHTKERSEDPTKPNSIGKPIRPITWKLVEYACGFIPNSASVLDILNHIAEQQGRLQKMGSEGPKRRMVGIYDPVERYLPGPPPPPMV